MADWFAQNAPKQQSDWFSQNAPKAETPSAPATDQVGDFFQHAIVDPIKGAVGTVQRIVTPPQTTADKAAFAVGGPLGPLVKDIAVGSVQSGKNAVEAVKKGDYKTAIHQGVAAVPVVGPLASQIGTEVANGQYGAAAGDVASLLLPKAISKVKGVTVAPKIVNPNAAEAAAMQYLEERGVPVSAAAKTGNPYVRNVQKAADSTPLGAIVAQKAQTATTNALRNEASSLVQQATPEVSASTLYGKFRDAEANPANIKRIQVGTKTVDTGVVDANGKAITRTVPVTEDVALPVKVGGLKDQIRPIYDEISKWWEPAKKNTSAGYQAMKSILEGPDVVPASQAEAGLGGLKELAREGDGRSAGIAKFIIPKLQNMVDDAAAQGGSKVVQALQQGRKAAAAEIAVGKLQKIFDKATAEGGFNREAGIWQDWQRSKPEISKQIEPGLVSNLDKFFLGAKKIAENPNPSGTTVVAISAGSGSLMITNPLTGIPMALGAGALSKLLHSTKGTRALTNGMKIPLGNKAAGAAVAAQILRMAGDDAKVIQFPKAADSQSPQSEIETAQLGR